MEPLVGGDVGHFDTQQILDQPRRIVAFTHLGHMRHCALERVLCRLGVIGQPDPDIGGERLSQLRLLDDGPVGDDHARALQFLPA